MLDEKIPVEKFQDNFSVNDLKIQVKAWFLVSIFVIFLFLLGIVRIFY